MDRSVFNRGRKPLIHDQPGCQTGLTLMELMVTVSIAAILLAAGIPSFLSTVRTNALATQTNEVRTGLAYARAEALRLNRRVNWTYQAGAAPEWQVWQDRDGDGVLDADELLRRGELRSDVTVSGTGSGFPHVVYQPDGTVTGPGWGSLWMCMPTTTPEANVRRLVVIVSGRVRAEQCDCDNSCSGPAQSCSASDCDDLG